MLFCLVGFGVWITKQPHSANERGASLAATAETPAGVLSAWEKEMLYCSCFFLNSLPPSPLPQLCKIINLFSRES